MIFAPSHSGIMVIPLTMKEKENVNHNGLVVGAERTEHTQVIETIPGARNIIFSYTSSWLQYYSLT